MPHAVEPEDEEVGSLLQTQGIDQVLEDLNARDLDTGDKADDARDFEDISDDDLPDDAEVPGSTDGLDGSLPAFNADLGSDLVLTNDANDQHNGAGDPFDDLFGDRDQGSPDREGDGTQKAAVDDLFNDGLDIPLPEAGTSLSSATAIESSFAQELDKQAGDTEVSDDDDEVREQRMLFAQAQREREDRLRRGDNVLELPPAPQTNAELFSVIWPQFEQDKPPRFSELLPAKRAHYLSKTPLKPPKPVNPTKIGLEVEQDQEKSFRLPGMAVLPFAIRQAEASAKGIVLTADDDGSNDASEDDSENISVASGDLSDVGNYKWQDIVAICQDWTIPSPPASEHEDADLALGDRLSEHDDLFMELEYHDGGDSISSGSKRKRQDESAQPLQVLHDLNASYEDPEATTARLAKKVRLDMNDSELLIDPHVAGTSRDRKQLLGGHLGRGATVDVSKLMNRKYNISNDEAYDMLKENRQSKIRSTLGSLAIEHATPAARLQYPAYKVKLEAKEARSFHRPTFNPDAGLAHFEKQKHLKRKHFKGREPHEIFAKTEDLTQGDNSHALLLEYSEEYPVMLSNLGMGSRLINYYRRRDEVDTTRPKAEIGEAEILLTQDKSPFYNFGDVAPGETMPTISNAMYRAPIFRHENRPQDFLLSTTKTASRRKWHLKAIDNLHVVGQQFPSVEVPGTHSRKVTDASKKRLRMLSYRIFKKKRKLQNLDILKHNPGSDIAQNRSKMREFMDYDKDRGWLPKAGEFPEEATIRSWITPEDICLLESMQVGDRQLQDAGYNKDDEDLEDQDDNAAQAKSIDQLLAPWQTTKNFLNATQGRAMLQLHGEGDPTGRGEAFSFIRTSMKGGFKQVGESVEDRLSARNRKELGGHSYNVASQQQAYNDEIKRIWEKQRTSLSSNVEIDDVDMDGAEGHVGGPSASRGRTPSSALPGGGSRYDNETGSAFSRTSQGSEAGNVLRIVRNTKDRHGHEEQTEEIVRDPKVYREYMKRRKQIQLANLNVSELVKTGDPEVDAVKRMKLESEIARLKRNGERKAARDRLKGINSAASPEGGSPGGAEDAEGTTNKKNKNQPGTTQRKCANCGQVGHIKTNKKLCPMLNGTVKQDEGMGNSAFGALNAPGAEDPAPAGFGSL